MNSSNLNRNTLTPIQDSLFILFLLRAMMKEYLNILHSERKDSESIVFAAVSSQLMILTCSYIDEWNHFGKLSKESENVKKVRSIVKPAIDKITEWKDLQNFRNTILAHNFRNKKGENVLFDGIFYELPNKYPDYLLLVEFINFIGEKLHFEFKKDYNLLLPLLKKINKSSIKEGIKTEQEALDIFKETIYKFKK